MDAVAAGEAPLAPGVDQTECGELVRRAGARLGGDRQTELIDRCQSTPDRDIGGPGTGANEAALLELVGVR